DVHVHGRRWRFTAAPALQTLELIDGPVHAALDAGLVALDGFEFGAVRDAETLEFDLAGELFPLTDLPSQALELFATHLKLLARGSLLVRLDPLRQRDVFDRFRKPVRPFAKEPQPQPQRWVVRLFSEHFIERVTGFSGDRALALKLGHRFFHYELQMPYPLGAHLQNFGERGERVVESHLLCGVTGRCVQDSLSNFTELRPVSSTKSPLGDRNFGHQADLGATLGHPLVAEFLKERVEFQRVFLTWNHDLVGAQPVLGRVEFGSQLTLGCPRTGRPHRVATIRRDLFGRSALSVVLAVFAGKFSVRRFLSVTPHRFTSNVATGEDRCESPLPRVSRCSSRSLAAAIGRPRPREFRNRRCNN